MGGAFFNSKFNFTRKVKKVKIKKKEVKRDAVWNV